MTYVQKSLKRCHISEPC